MSTNQNPFKPRPAEQMAHDMVRAHNAKHAYGITLQYPSDKYFQSVGKFIVKHYNEELTRGD